MEKKPTKKGLKSSRFRPMTVSEIIRLVEWADDFCSKEKQRGKQKRNK